MGRKGRHRKGGRVTPRGTPPRGEPRRHHHVPADDDAFDLPLWRDVRSALTEDHPLSFLTLVSMLLALTDERRLHPLARQSDQDEEGPSRDQLVGTFLDVDCAETTALLTVIEAMSADDVERRRLRRELVARAHPLPAWLAALPATELVGAAEMTHVLGDGDNVMIGARLPGGDELTAVVYIDHNMGTLVKDAYVIPEPLGAVVELMLDKNDDPDIAIVDLDLADARARVTEAIELGVITFPPFESDTWPAERALVEWIVGLAPTGGRGYEPPEWTEADRAVLARQFFASPHAERLDGDEAYERLLESLLWFGCGYGPGDPLRWSPVAVEIVLGDWIPRKVIADVDYLAKAPELLRCFVRFSHAVRGIRASLTAETLAAIDREEPEYQRTIRSPRPQGPDALLAALATHGVGGPWADTTWAFEDEEPLDYEELMTEPLRRAVGGAEALEQLDDEPLPDEAFCWDAIPSDVHDAVGEVLALCDRCCEEMLDDEYRTACRRFLARVAAGDPQVFRRHARTDTAAAAICWAVGQANDLFRGVVRVKDLMAHFGLAQSSVSQRARTMLRAAGIETEYYGQVALGAPELLVSARRRQLIDRRDRWSSELLAAT